MPANLELKFRLSSLTEAQAIASTVATRGPERLCQRDTYFVVRHGRLKLRVINDTDGELIAYSRAEEQDERVSSYEKIRVEDSAGLRRALSGALGVLTEVKKERILFIVEGSRVHLDTVEGLGFFVEFEVPIDATTNGEHTMKILRDLFRVLDSDVVRVSYSDLQLVNRERECS